MKFPRLPVFAVILLAGFGRAFADDLATDESAPLRLQPSAQVDADGVFLNEVIKSDSALPALRLCDAPAFGKMLDLTRAQIVAFAHSAGDDSLTTNWTGAAAVRVSRRTRTLAETDALALVTGTLQHDCVKERGELELRFVRPWASIAVPDEPITVRILDLPTVGISTFFMTRFELRTAHETLGTWQASFEARIWSDVWVAGAPLKRGDSLDDSTVTRERRNIINLHEPVAAFTANDSTVEVAEAVPAGSPLLARFVKLRPVVLRGQVADGVMKEGALSITVRVEVLEDGAPGQIVHIRNPQSRRDIRGKVLNDQTILILL